MKTIAVCQVCQQNLIPLDLYYTCRECQAFLSDLKYSYSCPNNQLDVIWFNIKPRDNVVWRIYFWIREHKTQVEEVDLDPRLDMVKQYKIILELNFLLPITPKTVRDLPNKLKLWQTFS
jgi:hypothetical protein